jgi:hypothetical protein
MIMKLSCFVSHHNMTEPSGCFCQCNRNSVCRFCTVFCPNFGLVIIYLSTTTVRSWWNQWLSIVAYHSNSWWRWWSEGDGRSHRITSYNCTYCRVTFQLLLQRFLCRFLAIYDWNSQGGLHQSCCICFWFRRNSYNVSIQRAIEEFFSANLIHVS